MIDLSERSVAAELMDDFNLPSSEIDPVLAGLAKMNALFGGHQSIINALKQFPVDNKNIISDWGCGGGDVLIAIAQWARKLNINLKLTGVDAAPAAINFARQQSAAFPNIGYVKADVLQDNFAENQFDVIISSLFTHHFTDDEWVALISKMYRAAKRGIIITDLHRHWVLYYAVVAITRLFNNKMASYDGPLSVQRSFTRKELKKLLAMAGIKNYRLQWRWAFRWRIVIYKS
ncbi:methyltransferase domain-containing protein [Mucilaginibacter sp. KACC 22063]|uniref:methyltransferase domain-containing protein n=1 Tax=Mucilaginibacter sp. KACC 22063 TaxID=3025666 RepID=UPI0023656DC8|nr:methyltransferase domain-containing protein [Mucilaginibacter sp. KACC 22063]WDF55029.1 methyltransferase domain-containing protein [Mucilaginibacter sp. KACC 22063]